MSSVTLFRLEEMSISGASERGQRERAAVGKKTKADYFSIFGGKRALARVGPN